MHGFFILSSSCELCEKDMNHLYHTIHTEHQATKDEGRETGWKCGLSLGPSFFPQLIPAFSQHSNSSRDPELRFPQELYFYFYDCRFYKPIFRIST